MSGSSLIIGTSYYAIAYRFRNTVGITPYVPSGSQFPKERTLPWLAPPFKLIKLYNEGKLQRDALREAYLKVLGDESFNLNGVIGEIIDRFSVMPVLLGYHKDPQKCYRSILAEAINDLTDYTAVEVAEQHELLMVDFEKLMEEMPLP